MISAGDIVVAGVSGGADSVCLFHVLRTLRSRLGFSLYVIHVHHLVRGPEADRDAEFVRRLCEENSIPCKICICDVPAYAAEHKLSVEEAGRILRREAFAEYSLEVGGTKTALAHHMNDVAETVLFNMARGTGIAGQASLKAVRGTYIRPLLFVAREEITGWLENNHIPFCTDSTNSDGAYSRNFIRNRIIPELTEGVNRQAVRHLCEISEEAGQVEDFIAEYTRESLAKYAHRISDDAIVLSGQMFTQEKSYIAARVVKLALGTLAGTSRDLGRTHIRSVLGLAGARNGKMSDLPYGIRAESVYGDVRLSKKKAEKTERKEDNPALEAVIRPGDTVFFANLRISASLRAFSEETPEKNGCTKKFDYDKISGILGIRYRKAGDYLVIHPDGRKKSLSDFFTDRKVPRNLRDKIPLLASGSEILWVIGYRTGESCRIGTETRQVLSVDVRQENGGNYGR